MGYDYLIFFISIGITLLAQAFVTTNYNKYKRVETKSQKSGFEVARQILDENGLNDVYVVETQGTLSDHYDPRRKTIRLSKDIFHGTTVAANAVAAHEVGHAIQHKEGYSPLKIRNMILPLANLGSKLGYIVIVISFIAGITDLLWLGIGLIALMLLFQLLTLPVEFNASSRAKEKLKTMGFLNETESTGANNVLTAAALTYVASVLTALLEILRLVLIARSDD
ncbi:MAG: zinc metallopeptidase [Bacilli bacterium]|nr:zinc metallopeptidase [Bacilli bacterium]